MGDEKRASAGGIDQKKGMIFRTFHYFRDRYFLLTPALMFLSFPSYDVFFLKLFPLFAWFALVPLFLSFRGKNLKQVFGITFVTGLLGNVLTFHWIGNFGIVVPGGPVLILIFLVPFLTVNFTIKIFIAEYLSRRFERLRPLIYPSSWIILDWIASIGFLAFPMTFWGYSQFSFTPFIQMASVTGIMGITFVLILSNTLITGVAEHFRETPITPREALTAAPVKKLAALIIFVAAVTLCGGIVLLQNRAGSNRDLRVSVVQSCINPWVNWIDNKYRYLAELKELTEESLAENPDVVIWSESATLETITYNYERGMYNMFEQDLIDSVVRWGKPLITGEVGVVERQTSWGPTRFPQNNAMLIDSNGIPVLTYSKIFLVPFGEWFPYERVVPFLRPLLDSFGASQFVPGTEPRIFDLYGFRFGTLICYEGIFHRLCRIYKNMGAQFFVNITNDGWTHAYSGHMQHFAVSIFRAVENGIWYLRVGNTGYTAFIDPYGRITRSLPIWEKQYLVGDLDFRLNHRTAYQYVGDVVLYLAWLFIVTLSGVVLAGKLRKKDEKA